MIQAYNPGSISILEPLFSHGTTLLWFSAPWCGTCRAIKRVLMTFDQAHPASIIEINVDTDKNLVNQYRIQGVPALIILKNGIVIDRISGSLDYEEFIAWLKKNECIDKI